MHPCKKFNAGVRRVRSIRARTSKLLNRLSDALDTNSAYKHIDKLRDLNKELNEEIKELEKNYNLLRPVGY